MKLKTAMKTIVAAAVINCSAAFATPITYVEGATDLTNSDTTPDIIGTFDVGVNTVAGTIGPALLNLDFWDNWAAILPGTLEITGLTLDITGFSGTQAPGFESSAILGVADPGFDSAVYFDDNASFDATDFVAFGSSSVVGFVTAAGNLDHTYNYVWTITVAVADVNVPAPAGIVMLLSGLMVLGAGKLRRS